jgi:hypothetical protein
LTIVSRLLLAAATMVVSAPPARAAAPASVPEPGDAALFDTWTGYQSGRYLEGVVAGDFNSDGAPDVAWARQDFGANRMMVQLNMGDGTLSASVGYTATSQSNDIAAGDLEGDGDLDLVVVSQGDSLTNTIIDLYLNNGAGSFTRQTATGGSGPKKLALADLNGDQRPDIAVTNYWGSSDDVSVLLNNGNGTFGTQVRYSIGDVPAGITAADLDGDGDRDLAVGRQQSGGQIKIHLLTNNGAGGLVESKILSITSFSGDPIVVSADWDGDTDQDLAVSGVSSNNKVWILTNTGGLNFSTTSYPAGFSAFDMRPADIELDGDVDLVSTDYSSNAGELVLLKNNGNGTFAPPISIESGRNPHDMDVADFNLDGRPDIAVANRVTDTGAIHPQRADGTFSASVSVPPIYRTPFAPYSLVDADVDLDGDVDVVATLPDFFSSGDSVQVMLNNGDGVFLQGDNISSTNDYPQGIAAGDFNADGYPDLVWTPDSPPYPYVYVLNNGDGTFGAPVARFIDTCGTGDASTADADNDGDVDILIANNRGGPGCEAFDTTVRIALNNGDATFQDDYGVEFFLGQEYALGADFNGDGLTDLMSAAAQNGVALGTGGGAFGPATLTNVRGTELVPADLDGDGDLDVASGDSSFSQTTVMRNNGNGGFTHNTIYLSEQVSGYSNAWDLDLGDFDGDGNLDIAVSNTSANDTGIHFGHGDGTFEVDQIRYGTHANPLDIVVADVDGDGRADIVTGASIGSSFVSPRGISPLLNLGAGGPTCTLIGTEGDDVLSGTGGADVICGLGGNDRINARGGDDTVFGGAGDDLVKAGAGADEVFGEDGSDTLDARDAVSGNDLVDGGPGSDRCVERMRGIPGSAARSVRLPSRARRAMLLGPMMFSVRRVSVAVAAVTLLVLVPAGGSASEAAPSASPAARAYMGMAYDQARGEVVLFGGWNGGSYLGDTWTWDGAAWTQRTPPASPGIRGNFGMAYDAVRGEVVLFGGWSGSTYLGDTWTWDGTTWTKETPASSPSARYDLRMAFDATRNEVVLFGGQGAIGMLGDTWTWDGATWTQEAPSNSPGSRSLVGMAQYGAGPVVIFGGWDGALTHYRQTWTWNGSTWAPQRGRPRPSGRASLGMAYDAARREIIMFGGTLISGVRLNDTWSWVHGVWTRLDPPVSPGERDGMGMVYDSARQEMVLFGGYQPIVTGDTWTWDGSTWTLADPG